MKYTEILAKNKKLTRYIQNFKEFKVLILSNVVVNQLKEILEYKLRVKKLISKLNSVTMIILFNRVIN